MKKTLVASLVGGLALLSGCVSGRREPPPGAELAGHSLRLVAANGQNSTLSFRRDGRVRSTFGAQSAEGRWNIERGSLCFTWARNFRECWPYASPFQRGRTVTVRSNRGNVVRVTLLQ
jgi:hypothetical protein